MSLCGQLSGHRSGNGSVKLNAVIKEMDCWPGPAQACGQLHFLTAFNIKDPLQLSTSTKCSCQQVTLQMYPTHTYLWWGIHICKVPADIDI